MKTVRYLGPLAGVEIAVLQVEVARGATVDVPDELVDGTPHTFYADYVPVEPVEGEPAPVDSSMIAEHGTEGLLAQTYEDADGEVQPCWELVKAKAEKTPKSGPPAE